ncbi:hypothetical protein PS1_001670 [Malus domestica]
MRVLLVYLAWMCCSAGLFKKKGTTGIVDYTNLEDMKCAVSPFTFSLQSPYIHIFCNLLWSMGTRSKSLMALSSEMLLTANLFALVKDMGRRALWKWVHKYGKSTTGESWDIVVDEETYYE